MNTIKTKIGFETKPYAIQALYFDELFNISTKAYGRILLGAAIFLSAFLLASNAIYLRQTRYQLNTLQEETLQLEKEHQTLVAEYDLLASSERLQAMAFELNMHTPKQEDKLHLPR